MYISMSALYVLCYYLTNDQFLKNDTRALNSNSNLQFNRLLKTTTTKTTENCFVFVLFFQKEKDLSDVSRRWQTVYIEFWAGILHIDMCLRNTARIALGATGLDGKKSWLWSFNLYQSFANDRSLPFFRVKKAKILPKWRAPETFSEQFPPPLLAATSFFICSLLSNREGRDLVTELALCLRLPKYQATWSAFLLTPFSNAPHVYCLIYIVIELSSSL